MRFDRQPGEAMEQDKDSAPAFTKGGKPGPGRPKGLRDRRTTTAMEAIALAAEALGGHNRLVSWAKEAPENERTFWGTIYPKLLPLQVTGKDGGAIEHVFTWQDD